MLELRRTKEVGTGDTKRKVGCYRSVSDIVEGMEICLDCISEIRNLMEGLELEAFIDDREVLDRCAINLQIVGNQIGMLDPGLQFNDAMKTAYDSRTVIAHQYGGRTFRKDVFFRNLEADLDHLEEGCRYVIVTVTTQDIVFSGNRKKRRLFRRGSSPIADGPGTDVK